MALNVFLVENHADTAAYLRLYLENGGHQVTVAYDVATALERLPGSNSDVLLADITLPDGNAWELLEKLGSARPPVAIAMSGRSSRSDQERSLQVGFQHHLIKPFLPDDLDRLLAEVRPAE